MKKNRQEKAVIADWKIVSLFFHFLSGNIREDPGRHIDGKTP